MKHNETDVDAWFASMPVARVGTIEKIVRPLTKLPAWIYYASEEERENCIVLSTYAAAVDYAERQFIRRKIDMIITVDCD